MGVEWGVENLVLCPRISYKMFMPVIPGDYLEIVMQQLDLFGYVTFSQAYDHQLYIDELRADYLAGYINSMNKPCGMSWDIWFKYVVCNPGSKPPSYWRVVSY
jgi:hypothetical protein